MFLPCIYLEDIVIVTIAEFSCHDSWQQEDHTSKKLFTIVSYKSSHSTRYNP